MYMILTNLRCKLRKIEIKYTFNGKGTIYFYKLWI